MAFTHLQGTLVNTTGNSLAPSTRTPDFSVAKLDLSEPTLGDLAGKTTLPNTFPSTDAGVCTASVRRFNIEAAVHPDVMVISVSRDLPFALGRFYNTEGTEYVITTSGFRSNFGTDYGAKLADSPMAGLLARAIIIIGADGTTKYTELVGDTAQNPNFEATLVSS